MIKAENSSLNKLHVWGECVNDINDQIPTDWNYM